MAAAAKHRCGYCLTAEAISGAQMHVEHLTPLSHGGTSDEPNLWLACAWCNSYKAARAEGTDPETGTEAPLFNPRTQRWSDHFAWSDDGARIVGRTATGRATVLALRQNNDYVVSARRHWTPARWHPPDD